MIASCVLHLSNCLPLLRWAQEPFTPWPFNGFSATPAQSLFHKQQGNDTVSTSYALNTVHRGGRGQLWVYLYYESVFLLTLSIEETGEMVSWESCKHSHAHALTKDSFSQADAFDTAFRSCLENRRILMMWRNITGCRFIWGRGVEQEDEHISLVVR